MIAVFHPTGIVKGTVQLPTSKSISNRALIIQAISGFDFGINNLSTADDTQTLFNLLNKQSDIYDCGDGGTTFRFLLALKVLKNESCIITGSKRMQERPVKELVEALNELGADIQYINEEGFPPLKINPAILNAEKITINASISSQFISALMMIAPSLPNGLIIHLEGEIVSMSYILMTKQLLEYFGAKVIINKGAIYIQPGQYVKQDITIEKDWSAASYWFEVAALAKEADLFLEGLTLESLQGDKIIVDLIKDFGVSVSQELDGLRITKKINISPKQFEFNFINHPDLVQTLAFLCAVRGVKGMFDGIQTLKIKETDRVEGLKLILEKFGIDLIPSNNSFTIEGTRTFQTDIGVLPVFNDHRMAMSMAPLSLVAGKLYIENQKVTAKSYPQFWGDLNNVGFITEDQE